MKREIKFRGKTLSGHWVFGNLIIGKVDGRDFCQIEKSDSKDFQQWEVIPETVGQFTGGKDKNGEEMYEGDVVKKMEDINGNFVSTIIQTFEVIFDRYSFQFKPIEDRKHKQFTFKPHSDVEKIGNIYDNPELLTQS